MSISAFVLGAFSGLEENLIGMKLPLWKDEGPRYELPSTDELLDSSSGMTMGTCKGAEWKMGIFYCMLCY
jgi:hypothetical protein